MKCAVKFCGGCNPRYDRGEALKIIQNHFRNRVDFEIAKEGTLYDCILVIGGCTNCCASYAQYDYNADIKIWDENHIEESLDRIEDLILTSI